MELLVERRDPHAQAVNSRTNDGAVNRSGLSRLQKAILDLLPASVMTLMDAGEAI
jgi:hypothetical protein